MSLTSGLIKGLYKDGTRVVRGATPSSSNLMKDFGTYGRVPRPGNVSGWTKPPRLEARAVDRAYTAKGAGKASARQHERMYDYGDTMERGEPQTHAFTSSLRGHIDNHLAAKGITHKPRLGVSRGQLDFYAPKGGDLSVRNRPAGARPAYSKKELLKLRRKAGPKGGTR